MIFQYPDGVADWDHYDFLLYTEGAPEDSRAAAKRLDRRAVSHGQMNLTEYVRLWGEAP